VEKVWENYRLSAKKKKNNLEKSMKIKFLILALTLNGFGVVANDWSSSYISSLSSGDCKGIASKDKSWCTTNDCKGIASGDKSWCQSNDCKGVSVDHVASVSSLF
jgi:hypothetical protein